MLRHRLIVLAIVSLCSVARNCYSQGAGKINEPDFINKFSVLSTDGSLKPLQYDREERESRNKAKVTTVVLVMPGERCATRTSLNTPPTFIVRLSSQDTDPSVAIRAYQLTVVAGRRELDFYETVKQKQSSGTNDTEKDLLKKAEIPLDSSKYGEKSVQVKPRSHLQPGEYAITVDGVEGSYCFGVDKNNP